MKKKTKVFVFTFVDEDEIRIDSVHATRESAAKRYISFVDEMGLSTAQATRELDIEEFELIGGAYK